MTGGGFTENIAKLKELLTFLEKEKEKAQGGNEYGSKLAESINVIKRILNEKIKDQETAAIVAAAEAKAKGQPMPEEKPPVVPEITEDDIKNKITQLKKVQKFIEEKDQEVKGGNEYGSKLSESISVIDEILIEKIKDQEAAGQKLAKENAAAEDKAANGQKDPSGMDKCGPNKFKYDPMRDIEEGGTKRTKRTKRKQSSTKRMRSSTKRSKSTR